MINTLNSLMFGTMNWDLKYLTISNNEVKNNVAIRWAIIYPNWNMLWVKQNLKTFCIRNKKWYLIYFIIKKDRDLNIVAIRNQIFKTFSWTISTKLEIDYDRIKLLNSSMFDAVIWNMKYLTTKNSEVINSFVIQ